MLCCSLRFLLERVQDDNPISKRRQVDNAERACTVANPDFANAATDCLHRPPVVRFKTALNSIKLVPGDPPRAHWKITEPSKRVAGEFYRFQPRFSYIKTDIKSKATRMRWNGYGGDGVAAKAVFPGHLHRSAIMHFSHSGRRAIQV